MTAIAERLRRLARQFQRPVCCTACEFPRAAGRRLISGPWGIAICEACINDVADRTGMHDPSVPCSFCGHRGEPLAGTWSRLAICTSCTELSRRIFAEDDHARRR